MAMSQPVPLASFGVIPLLLASTPLIPPPPPEAAAANNFMGEEAEESFMFDSSLLRQLDFSDLTCFKNDISPADPGPGLKIRSLGTGDYDRGEIKGNKEL